MKLKITKHNLTGYKRGCRCDVCKNSGREYREEHKEKIQKQLREWEERNKEKRKEYRDKYYAENKEICRKRCSEWSASHRSERNEYARKWRILNPDRARRRKTKSKKRTGYYEENKERIIEKAKAWAKTERGRESKKITKHNRRAAKGHSTPEQVKSRMAMFGYTCYLCGENGTEIDHVIPIKLGGTNWPANLRPICRRCNAKKSCKRLSDLPKLD